MPELPEVEIIKRELTSIINHTIVGVRIGHLKLRYPVGDLHKALNATIIAVIRRAKYLIMNLDVGYAIVVHLGMSGRLTLIDKNIPVTVHDHIDIVFFDKMLRYNDARRFGCVLFMPIANLYQHNLFIRLGPEPLSNSFNSQYLLTCAQHRSISIKQLIMNNNIVVGIGNIYASEALFVAKIHPIRLSKSLIADEAKLLVEAIRAVLLKAINLGGSTLRDYQHLDGSHGLCQNTHYVYGRANLSCYECGHIICSRVIAQRNTFYCNHCQS